MHCFSCSAENDSTVPFCWHCGASLWKGGGVPTVVHTPFDTVHTSAITIPGTHANQRIDIHAMLNQGFGLLNIGRYQEALSVFDEVLRFDPNNAKAHYGRGVAFLDPIHVWNVGEALNAYDNAVMINWDFAEAHFGRSHALFLLNRIPEQLRALDEGLQLDPKNAAAYWNRGIALTRLERYEEAIRDFDNASSLDSNRYGHVTRPVEHGPSFGPRYIFNKT